MIDKNYINSLAYADMAGRYWVFAEMLRNSLIKAMEYMPHDHWHLATIKYELERTEHMSGTFKEEFTRIEEGIFSEYEKRQEDEDRIDNSLDSLRRNNDE